MMTIYVEGNYGMASGCLGAEKASSRRRCEAKIEKRLHHFTRNVVPREVIETI